MRKLSETTARRFVDNVGRDLLLAKALRALKNQILRQIRGSLKSFEIVEDAYGEEDGEDERVSSGVHVAIPGRVAETSVPIDSFLSERNGKSFVNHALIAAALKRLAEAEILERSTRGVLQRISCPSSKFALRYIPRDRELVLRVGLVERIEEMFVVRPVLEKIVPLPQDLPAAGTHLVWDVATAIASTPWIFTHTLNPYMYSYLFDIPEAAKIAPLEKVLDTIRKQLGMREIPGLSIPTPISHTLVAAQTAQAAKVTRAH